MTQGLNLVDLDFDHALHGTSKGDTLDGRGGSDELTGYAGDDTYVFTTGSGRDFVYEEKNNGIDTIKITGGITPDQIRIGALEFAGGLNDPLPINTFVLQVLDNADDQIQIALVDNTGFVFGQPPEIPNLDQRIERIEFDDGTVWDVSQGLNLMGVDEAQFITGTDQGDTFDAKGGLDIINSYGGDDTLIGGEGDDNIDGGADTDTAVYSGNYTNYAITDNTSDWTVQDNVGSDGTDTLENVEFFEFADGTFDTATGVFTPAINIVTGTSGSDDPLNGTSGVDEISGLEGNDNIIAGDGDDILIGGEGHDTLTGGNGVDTADYTGAFSRVIVDLDAGTASDGFGWTDTLNTVENIIGTQHFDNIIGDAANNNLQGHDGNDILEGNAGNDVIEGGAGNDIIDGGAGDDTVNGNDGNDLFTYTLADNTTSTDTYDGDAGLDRISFYFTAAEYTQAVKDDLQGFISFMTANADITSSIGAAYSFTEFNLDASDIEEIFVYEDGVLDESYFTEVDAAAGSTSTTGTTGNDVIQGNNQSETLNGLAGNDVIYGEAGADTIYGAEGDDEIHGGGWADLIFGDGGWGASYGGNDLIYGDAGNDTVNGRAGDDTIYGGTGHDLLKGQEGDDVIYGEDGADTIYGDINFTDTHAGDDVLYGGAGNDTINGFYGNDTIYGDDGNDLLRGQQGMDYIEGNLGADRLEGGDGMDRLYGGAQNDIIEGGNDMDILRGDEGFDKLYGDAGNDILFADEGWDFLYGGAGMDTFIFDDITDYASNQYNSVKDFNAAEDVLNIDMILDTAGYDPLADALSDFVSVTDNGSHTFIAIDETGAGGAGNYVAKIDNYTGHGLDADDMVANGTLIV